MTYSRVIISTIEDNSLNPIPDSLDIVLNKCAFKYLNGTFDTLGYSMQNEVVVKFDSLLQRYDSTPAKVSNYMFDNKLDTAFQTYYSINEISFIDFDKTLPVYKNNLKSTLQNKPKGIYINSSYKEGNYYAIQYDFFVDFIHKRKVILSEMKGLLIMILITLSTVIVTFVYTLITLQRQKKLSELKDDFINNISHEFKTPLSIIALATSSLKQEKVQRDPLKFKEVYTQLEKQNKALSKMIDNVIDKSYLDRKSTQNEMENVDLKKYFSELISTFKTSEATEREIQIVQEYLIPDDFRYNLDPVQFSRAIVNLLSNSIKYCTLNPVITIRILLEEQLRIEIIDNGIGIKDKHARSVFNEFFRAENPNEVKGLGLGLYIVKKIIENHHGTIRLESEWGKGTTAIIDLPN